MRRAGGRAGPGAAYLLEVEEGGRAGHGVREHAAGVGQQEAARVRHGAQHGAAGGRPAAGGSSALAARLAPSARPLVCARALPPGRPLGLLLLLFFLLGPPLPLAVLLRREAWTASSAPLPGAPLPGRGCWGECAREHGRVGCVRERSDESSGGAGARHFGATGALSAKSGACACECARVRACVAVGGGVPGVLQHQTEPRTEGRESGTTARQLITHLTPRPPAPSPGALRGPPPPRIQQLPRTWGLESPSGPARSARRCGEERLCRLCGPTGRRFVLLGVQRGASHKEGRLSGGDVGDVMRASTQRLPSRGTLLRCPELGNLAGAPRGFSCPPPGPQTPFTP